ncbi:MAG: transposase [Saccharothrix sp.]|nr:transposase [Saccharothrix sp.]
MSDDDGAYLPGMPLYAVQRTVGATMNDPHTTRPTNPDATPTAGATQPRYSDAFKRDAVARFHAAAGKSRTFAAVAAQLGVNPETLRGWVRQEQQSVGNVEQRAAEHAELQQLRTRVAELEKERDLLRRAAQYFAREMPATA